MGSNNGHSGLVGTTRSGHACSMTGIRVLFGGFLTHPRKGMTLSDSETNCSQRRVEFSTRERSLATTGAQQHPQVTVSQKDKRARFGNGRRPGQVIVIELSQVGRSGRFGSASLPAVSALFPRLGQEKQEISCRDSGWFGRRGQRSEVRGQ